MLENIDTRFMIAIPRYKYKSVMPSPIIFYNNQPSFPAVIYEGVCSEGECYITSYNGIMWVGEELQISCDRTDSVNIITPSTDFLEEWKETLGIAEMLVESDYEIKMIFNDYLQNPQKICDIFYRSSAYEPRKSSQIDDAAVDYLIDEYNFDVDGSYDPENGQYNRYGYNKNGYDQDGLDEFGYDEDLNGAYDE